jgi:hypothetical protein
MQSRLLLSVVHPDEILNVIDGERSDDCVDVSIFTQHARCASAHHTIAKTDAIA